MIAKTKNIKLKNYKQFVDRISSAEEDKKQMKIKETAEYIEHIKIHDKKAYEKYLSYSTYLECY